MYVGFLDEQVQGIWNASSCFCLRLCGDEWPILKGIQHVLHAYCRKRPMLFFCRLAWLLAILICLVVGATTSSEFFAALHRKDTSTKFKNIPVCSLMVCARKYIIPSYPTYHAASINSLAAQTQNRVPVSRVCWADEQAGSRHHNDQPTPVLHCSSLTFIHQTTRFLHALLNHENFLHRNGRSEQNLDELHTIELYVHSSKFSQQQRETRLLFSFSYQR